MTAEELFLKSCEKGDLGFVRYYLLACGVDINHNDGQPLAIASDNKQSHIVKYLLNSPELKTHANLNANQETAFTNSCYHGDLELIEYYFTKCKTKPDLSSIENVGVLSAVAMGHFHVLNYLMTSPDIPQKPVLDSLCFINSYEQKNMPMMNYLLYDLDMQFKESDIKKLTLMLKGDKLPDALNLISKRDLFKKLNSIENLNPPSVRVKI